MAVTSTTKDNVTVVTGTGGLPIVIFGCPPAVLAGVAPPTTIPTGINRERFRIKVIRWVFPAAAAGNAVVLQDLDGNKVWESTATGANFEDQTNFGDEFRFGLKVTTFDGGTLYLYHGLT